MIRPKGIGIGGALLGLVGLVPTIARAHCPLCTAGAGGAAAIASSLGIGMGIVGVFLGAFGLAMGLWFDGVLDREIVPQQRWVVGIGLFLSIIVPVTLGGTEYSSIYVNVAGGYGTPLNRTYLVDRFLLGALLGGMTVAVAPRLSRWITERRDRTLPFQGLVLTFVLLGFLAGLLHIFA